ncbi:hypothetical protein VTO42DRAFT_4556 [Malbranchea cinnamomea]
MANLLLEKRGDGTPETVGPNWVTRFIQRHDDLKSKFTIPTIWTKLDLQKG